MSDASSDEPAHNGVPLDLAVRAALRSSELSALGRPSTLVLTGTGATELAARLASARRLSIGALPGAPATWCETQLCGGFLGEHSIWLCEDQIGEPENVQAARGATWERVFPVWLAAASGAKLLLHTSAGLALASETPPPARSIAALSDHLNLSGSTPLAGLGESTLGPLFPDLSELHHRTLRKAALHRARTLGLVVVEAVAACGPGPALTTPAERRFYARAGADLLVQGLAAPLLAAAHAGLGVLALAFVAEAPEASTALRQLVQDAADAEAALAELCLALAPDLEDAARVLADA
jgi:purine-nucleoside phosphorylase